MFRELDSLEVPDLKRYEDATTNNNEPERLLIELSQNMEQKWIPQLVAEVSQAGNELDHALQEAADKLASSVLPAEVP